MREALGASEVNERAYASSQCAVIWQTGVVRCMSYNKLSGCDLTSLYLSVNLNVCMTRFKVNQVYITFKYIRFAIKNLDHFH